MVVVRVTENVRAVQSSYYSSCPWIGLRKSTVVKPRQTFKPAYSIAEAFSGKNLLIGMLKTAKYSSVLEKNWALVHVREQRN
jgi:hypothetical protein